jgi:DNA-binding transcriptional regulator GbsR (MarR family)
LEDEKHPYNQDVRKIESEIVEYLVASPIYSTRNEITTRVLLYILLRNEISQNLLKKLTGYSSGKISQELSNLVNAGLIIRKKIPGVRKKFYTFKSIEHISTVRIKNIISAMIKWEEELREVRDEMIENRSKLENMNGYHNILKILDFYIPLMKIYEKFAENLEIK